MEKVYAQLLQRSKECGGQSHNVKDRSMGPLEANEVDESAKRCAGSTN